MLAHFSPGAFAGVADDAGITAWVSFAFFTGIGRDFTGIVPVSAGARALVGAQLIPSIGWALVVFAVIMVGFLFRSRHVRTITFFGRDPTRSLLFYVAPVLVLAMAVGSTAEEVELNATFSGAGCRAYFRLHAR